MIVVAGDMVTANEKKTRFEVPTALMKRLAEQYPVYYGMGNHEYRMKVYRKAYGNMFEEYKSRLKEYLYPVTSMNGRILKILRPFISVPRFPYL